MSQQPQLGPGVRGPGCDGDYLCSRRPRTEWSGAFYCLLCRHRRTDGYVS